MNVSRCVDSFTTGASLRFHRRPKTVRDELQISHYLDDLVYALLIMYIAPSVASLPYKNRDVVLNLVTEIAPPHRQFD